MNILTDGSEAAKRHAQAMSQASFAHGQANPADADPMVATMGAAIQLGVMVAQLIDMGFVPSNNAGRLMNTMSRLAEETAASTIGIVAQ